MDTDSRFKEKRAFRRIPKKVSVEVTELSFPISAKPDATAVGRDISGGGICFTMAQAYEAGTTLSLKIRLKGWAAHKKPHSWMVDIVSEEPLSAIGKVVWCAEAEEPGSYDVGIRFLDVYEDDHKALMRYLDSN